MFIETFGSKESGIVEVLLLSKSSYKDVLLSKSSDILECSYGSLETAISQSPKNL